MDQARSHLSCCYALALTTG